MIKIGATTVVVIAGGFVRVRYYRFIKIWTCAPKQVAFLCVCVCDFTLWNDVDSMKTATK